MPKTPRQPNRRATPRFKVDRFMPVVLQSKTSHHQIGGHLVNLSASGARIVAPPTLAPIPQTLDDAILMFARSDENREIDIDGVRQAVSIGEIRQVPGARAFRLSFEGDVSPRIAQFARRLALEAGDTPQEPGLVEFDPDVWSGWAAISTVAPSG